MAAQPASISDADRIRTVSRILVLRCRRLEAAALRAASRTRQRCQRMVQQEPLVRNLDLHARLLFGYLGERASRSDRIRTSNGARYSSGFVSRMVEDVQ